MEKIYVSPEIEILEIEVEVGFAASNQTPQINDLRSGGSAF